MTKPQLYQASEQYLLLAPKDEWIFINDIPRHILDKVLIVINSGCFKKYKRWCGITVDECYRIMENDDFTAFKLIPGKSRLEEDKCRI